MNISTHKTEYFILYFILESGGHTHTHTFETINPTSYTRQHMLSQVKHFQQIRKIQLIKFNPNRQTVVAIKRTQLERLRLVQVRKLPGRDGNTSDNNGRSSTKSWSRIRISSNCLATTTSTSTCIAASGTDWKRRGEREVPPPSWSGRVTPISSPLRPFSSKTIARP